MGLRFLKTLSNQTVRCVGIERLAQAHHAGSDALRPEWWAYINNPG